MELDQSASTFLARARQRPRALIPVSAAVFGYFALRHWAAGGQFTEKVDLEGKHIIVTGGNDGLGLETVRQLSRMGKPHITVACRNPTKASSVVESVKKETGNENIDILALDLADSKAIKHFSKEFKQKYPKIDQLILNAGTWPEQRRTTADGFEECFGVNHLGHMLLTHELLPLVRRSNAGRIVVLSSKQHTFGSVDWDDLQAERKRFEGMKAYQQAKIANVLFAKELARRLKAQGSKIVVSSVHPGVIKTELHRDGSILLKLGLTFVTSLFGKTMTQGVQTTLYAALSSELNDKSGHYLADCKIAAPNAKEVTDEAALKMWEISCKMLGLPTDWS